MNTIEDLPLPVRLQLSLDPLDRFPGRPAKLEPFAIEDPQRPSVVDEAIDATGHRRSNPRDSVGRREDRVDKGQLADVSPICPCREALTCGYTES